MKNAAEDYHQFLDKLAEIERLGWKQFQDFDQVESRVRGDPDKLVEIEFAVFCFRLFVRVKPRMEVTN